MSKGNTELIHWSEEDIKEARSNRDAVKAFHKKWFKGPKTPRDPKKKRKRKGKPPIQNPKKPKARKLVWPKNKKQQDKKKYERGGEPQKLREDSVRDDPHG